MANGPAQRDRAMLKLNIEAGEPIVIICPDTMFGVVFMLLFFSDLTSLFDWNTKQLFIMLIAHYKTNRNV